MMKTILEPESMPLVRRWVSALMLVPAHERGSVVAAVEKQIAREFGIDRPS